MIPVDSTTWRPTVISRTVLWRGVDKVEIILERLFYDSPLQCKLYEKKLFLFFLTLSLVPVTMPDSGGTWQCLHLVNFKHNYIQGPMLNGWVLGFNQNKMEIHMVYQVMSSIWRKFKQGKRTGSAGSKRGKFELSVGIPGEASLRQLCLHKNMKQLRSHNKVCGKSIPGRGRSNWKSIDVMQCLECLRNTRKNDYCNYY